MRTGAAIALALIVSLVFMARSQDDPPQDSPQEENTEAVHDEIRALRDGLLAAIEEKDANKIVSFLDDNVVITTQDGEELRSVHTKSDVFEYLERLLTAPNAALKVMELNVEVDKLTTLYNNGNTGVAFGSSNDQYETRDGDAFQMQTRWTATLVKREGSWKLASLQVSSNLFDNPVLNGTRRVMYQVGIGGLVAGLLLGLVPFLISRSLRKRSGPQQ